MGTSEPTQTWNQPLKGRAVLGILLSAAGIVGLTAWCASALDNVERDPVRDLQVSVAIWCEDSVRGKLKAPATAKFPRALSLEVVVTGDTAAALRSHVDAQNAFGANLRAAFVCTALIE